VGFGAVGRSFGFPDVDAAEHLWTLDSPAHTWAGLSSPVRIDLRHSDGSVAAHAIGVAEVVAPDDPALAAPVRAVLAALAARGVTATCTRPDGPRYGALDADSNLPDVRIVLGAANPYGRLVLDEPVLDGTVLDEPVLDDTAERGLAVNGRVFIPAAKDRHERWIPDADLRGPRDLPVLIVEDCAALARELADGRVEVPVPDGFTGTSEPVIDYSVAVVNRGTPGFVVTPDGTLRVNLMRSCSGWPTGVWIDGERRTVPDGSSFAWQHWTHTFELSLIAGAGDWRQAGFARAGQEVNHPVLAFQVPAGQGPLPGELSLISVAPESVLLTAATAGAADGSISVRVYESAARPVTATVAVHGGTAAAYRTSPLDTGSGRIIGDDLGPPLSLSDGQAQVPLGAADVATVRVLPSRAQPEGPRAALARPREQVQPVFTRYWLHNAGPAPLGGVPVSVHVHPPRLRLENGQAQARVTVGCTGNPAAGQVELVVPPGLEVYIGNEGDAGELGYDLKPGDYAEFTLRVSQTDATAGRRLLAARVQDHLGQVLEDTCEVVTGDVPDGPLLSARLDTDEVELAPGGSANVTLRLIGLADSEIHGEISLISPFGTWGANPGDQLCVEPRTRSFSLPARGSAAIGVTITAASTARPGAHWWALARIAAHGKLVYTRSVAISLADKRP
jgi:alpha-mannosidase